MTAASISLLICLPILSIGVWFSSGQLGLSSLHPWDGKLSGLEYIATYDFIFSLFIVSAIGAITVRMTTRSNYPRIAFLIGISSGITVVLFFQSLTIPVTNAGQFRDIAGSLSEIFIYPFFGYMCWKTRRLLFPFHGRPDPRRPEKLVSAK